MLDGCLRILRRPTLVAVVLALGATTSMPIALADNTTTEADGTEVKRMSFKDGKPQAEIRTLNGVKHGVQIFWSMNGMRTETTFEHGVEHGPVRKYWPNGHLQSEGTHEYGLKSGTWTDYDPKGQVLFTKNYLYDKLTGTKQQFGDGSGPQKGRRIVVNETNYLLGLEHGTTTEYWHNGKLLKRGESVLGRREGSWDLHDMNGKLTKTVTYACGKKLERTIETAGTDAGTCRPPVIILSRPKRGRGKGRSTAQIGDELRAGLKFDERICELLKSITDVEVRVQGKPLTCPHFRIRTKTPTRGSTRG